MNNKKAIQESEALFLLEKRAQFNGKKLLTYAGIAFGGISVLLIGRYAFKKVNKSRLSKLYETKQAIIGERSKSKTILDLRQMIFEANLASKAVVDLKIDEEVVIPGVKGGTKVNFVFFYMEKLKEKQEKEPGNSKSDPFLPPFEPGLLITDFSSTHRLLFNKYAVMRHHVLIVTTDFHEQNEPLIPEEFAEGYKLLLALKGFCFYNAGTVSGASQKHKHLQVMPNLKEDEHGIINNLNKEAVCHEKPFRCSFFEFDHLVVPLPYFDRNQTYKEIGAKLEELYLDILKKLKIDTKKESYNMIMNESWMMIVRRSKEHFDTISLNSLTFIGSILLKGEHEKALIMATNPFKILESVTFPAIN